MNFQKQLSVKILAENAGCAHILKTFIIQKNKLSGLTYDSKHTFRNLYIESLYMSQIICIKKSQTFKLD